MKGLVKTTLLSCLGILTGCGASATDPVWRIDLVDNLAQIQEIRKIDSERFVHFSEDAGSRSAVIYDYNGNVLQEGESVVSSQAPNTLLDDSPISFRIEHSGSGLVITKFNELLQQLWQINKDTIVEFEDSLFTNTSIKISKSGDLLIVIVENTVITLDEQGNKIASKTFYDPLNEEAKPKITAHTPSLHSFTVQFNKTYTTYDPLFSPEGEFSLDLAFTSLHRYEDSLYRLTRIDERLHICSMPITSGEESCADTNFYSTLYALDVFYHNSNVYLFRDNITTNSGALGFWIAKYNASGEREWQHTFNSGYEIHDVKVNDDGMFIVHQGKISETGGFDLYKGQKTAKKFNLQVTQIAHTGWTRHRSVQIPYEYTTWLNPVIPYGEAYYSIDGTFGVYDYFVDGENLVVLSEHSKSHESEIHEGKTYGKTNQLALYGPK